MALTVEGVAKRAGVGKMTIYRRWPDIWAVVVDAVIDEVTSIRARAAAIVRQLAKASRFYAPCGQIILRPSRQDSATS